MSAPPVSAEECLIALLRLLDRIDAGEVRASREQRVLLKDALDTLTQIDIWGDI